MQTTKTLRTLLILLFSFFLAVQGCTDQGHEIEPETNLPQEVVKQRWEVTRDYHMKESGPAVKTFTQPVSLSIPQTVQIESTQAAKGKQYVYHIYPTGIPEQDWESLQSVVNSAGENGQNAKIMLKATNQEGVPTSFNLGQGFGLDNPDTYAVTVWGETHGHTGSVEFIGESSGGNQTTIKGGVTYDVFGDMIRVESFAFQVLDRDAATFRNIHFTDNAGVFAGESLAVFSTMPPVNKIQVVNCRFTHMVGSPLLVAGAGEQTMIKNNYFEDFGWEVGFFLDQPDLVFKDNQIVNEGSGYGLTLWQINGNMSIKDNSIKSRIGDFMFGFTTGIFYSLRAESQLEIKENQIDSDDSGIANNDFAGPQLFPVSISDNEIYVNTALGGFPFSLFSILGNDISNVCFRNNAISGTGAWAIEVASAASYWPGFYAPGDMYDISISNNDLSEFTAHCNNFVPLEVFGLTECPKVYLDTSTRDIEYCGEEDIANQGTDNSINEGNCQGNC